MVAEDCDGKQVQKMKEMGANGMGGGSGAAGHMVTSEPFPAGWRARWHGAHGDARSLPHREVGLELWDAWQHRSPSLSSSRPRLVQKLEKWESPLSQSRDKLA
jgi:hypothetical protein